MNDKEKEKVNMEIYQNMMKKELYIQNLLEQKGKKKAKLSKKRIIKINNIRN